MNRWWGRLVGLVLAVGVCAPALTPVEDHGALKVQGSKILDSKGQPTQLVGMSLFWSGWAAQFYNRRTVHWLAYDWKVSVLRIAMGVEGGGMYLDTNNGAAKNMKMVDSVIQASVDLGIYVIVDWHDHNAPDHQAQSIDFFQKVARKWGNTPNVIYEIFNEPHGIMAPDANGNGGEDMWYWDDQIKPYSQAVVDSIRAIDPDNLILIGNENWDQNPSGAAANPVVGKNLAYTLHFYSGSHVVSMANAPAKASTGAYTSGRTTLSRGVSLFLSEWGTTNADGGGGADKNLYLDKAQEWLDWAKTNSIGWCNWSVVNKTESSAALKPNANPLGGWNDTDLSVSGAWVRQQILALNAKYSFPEPPPVPPRKIDTTVLPGRIQAEGFATSKGVQFESSLDEDGSEDMGWIETGDGADYLVNVSEDGRYNLHIRAASNTAGGDFVLQNAAGVELKRVAIAGTKGWQKWVTTTDTTGVDLKAGTQILKVVFEGAATGSLFNLNWFELNHEIVPLRSRATWKKAASVSLREGKVLVQDALGFEHAALRDPAGKVLARTAVVDGLALLPTGPAKGVLITELTGPQRRELHSVVRAR
ncbi:MAG: cellulase family glycosylhydrolase [Fibrobacterota bacterium]|nr:MAG: cellulase family glycosylhydrolase [Fibrobacterota bacterium]